MIELLIVNAFFVIGMQFAFSPNNVLYFINEGYTNIAVRFLPNVLIPLKKPLFQCAPCMSSVWGVLFWTTGDAWYYYPVWAATLCGLVFVIQQLVHERHNS
jgi:hypothetical protein